MTWKPHATVAAIIEDQDRFLLVEEHADNQVVLNQPAGHLESGESLLEAVIRETREETAMVFEPVALVGVYRWQHPSSDKTFLRFTFYGKQLHRLENAELDPDIIQPVWMSYEEIKQHQPRLRSPLVLQCIEDYRAGYHYPLDILKDII